jgi:hypothetical protein
LRGYSSLFIQGILRDRRYEETRAEQLGQKLMALLLTPTRELAMHIHLVVAAKHTGVRVAVVVIIQFVQTIHRILNQVGTWQNLGPHLYHFSDMEGEYSIEPNYQTLKAIIQDLGFEFESEETSVPCTYSQNQTSMLQLLLQRRGDHLPPSWLLDETKEEIVWPGSGRCTICWTLSSLLTSLKMTPLLLLIFLQEWLG